MARKAKVAQAKKLKNKRLKAQAKGKKEAFSTKYYNRCFVCGRPRGYMRFFDMCRICVREKARKGELEGIRKASW